jgi:hypothetical protein
MWRNIRDLPLWKLRPQEELRDLDGHVLLRGIAGHVATASQRERVATALTCLTVRPSPGWLLRFRSLGAPVAAVSLLLLQVAEDDSGLLPRSDELTHEQMTELVYSMIEVFDLDA